MKYRTWWIACFAFLILIIRIKPYLYAPHFFAVPLDFDEGVYFAAGRLITQGMLPYRDFDLGHPPGIAWITALLQFILPTSSSAVAFTWTKLLYCCAGTLSSIILCLSLKRNHGLGLGLLAMALYATYPEVIALDRGVFLEPLVNLAVVCAVWLQEKQKSYLGIGLLLALAVSIKITAVIWLPVFAIWAWQSPLPKRNLGLWIGGGILGFVLFVLPWIIPDPASFFRDVIGFQLSRPPDGDLGIGLRLHSILRASHLPMNAMSVLAIAVFPWVPDERRSAYFGYLLACLLAVAVLLTARGFWGQYNALLALPQACFGAHCLYGLKPLRQRFRLLRPLALGVFGLLILSGIHAGIRSGRARAPEQVELIQFLATVPDPACIVAFEPAWLLMADRFPSSCPGRIIIDPYLVMLMDATDVHQAFATPAEAFATPASQRSMVAALQKADVAVLGPRGGYQLNVTSKQRLTRDYGLQPESTPFLAYSKRDMTPAR